MTQEILNQAIERSKHKCSHCGAQHMAFGWRNFDGTFMMESGAELEIKKKLGYRCGRIELRLAFANGNPKNLLPNNLLALCGRCFILHDVKKDDQPGASQLKLL